MLDFIFQLSDFRFQIPDFRFQTSDFRCAVASDCSKCTRALSFVFHRSPPTGGHYASPGALIKKALRAVIVKKGSTSYSKLSASQAMLDAGRAALLEDKDKMTKQSTLQRKPCSSTPGPRCVRRLSAAPGGVLLKTMSRLYSTAEHQPPLPAATPIVTFL